MSLNPPPSVITFLKDNQWSNFYKSLLSQFDKNGVLSLRQIKCVEDAMLKKFSNDNARTVNPEYSIKSGAIIEVKAWIARRLAADLGRTVFFRNLEVMDVVKETFKAYQLNVRFVSKIVTSCHVCGRELDTDVSRAVGIGPVCADKLGIPRPTLATAHETLKLIDQKCNEIGTLGPIWVPKSQIKTGGL